MKIKSTKAVLAVLVIACILVAGIGYVIASFVWTGTITWPAPVARPTSTFTVAAALNGAPQTGPTHISLGSPIYQGDSYVVVYTITSTANQAITVTENSTINGATATWDA